MLVGKPVIKGTRIAVEFVIGLLGLIFGAFTLARGLVSDVPVEGWASLMVMTSVMGGMILLAISVLGEYVWRTLDEVRGRPVYLERGVLRVESHPVDRLPTDG